LGKELFFNQDLYKKKSVLNSNREEYAIWKNENQQLNKPFFAIHTDFEAFHLKDISGGAMKLYVYLGFRAKYNTGELWESIPTMANYFNKDVRTIANWCEELEDRGLIRRYQTGFKRSANTFLKPYGFKIELYEKTELTVNDIDIKALESYIVDFTLKNQGRNNMKVVLFNYSFEEITINFLTNISEQYVSCVSFTNYTIEQLSDIKKLLSVYSLDSDMFDIEFSIGKYDNVKQLIYKNLLRYFEESLF